ncbi:Multifunctional non-homologous end joining protein LigD [compost metagenome]
MQNAWLLIKHEDKYAMNKKYSAEDKVPVAVKKKGLDFKAQNTAAKRKTTVKHRKKNYQPMLAKLVKHVPEQAGWIYEEKLDGYRAIATLKGNVATLTSRNGKDMSSDYAPLIESLQQLKWNAILDGEIIVRENKRSNFQALQNYTPGNTGTSLHYVVFDVLEINGSDISMMPLYQRKTLLEKLLAQNKEKAIEKVKGTTANGRSFLAAAKKAGWEGIIAKASDSIYSSGIRSSSWQKIKIQQSQEAIIAGYTRPEGERNFFGALVLAIQDSEGTLRYIGNCGTGFTQKSLAAIHSRLEPLKTVKKPFSYKVAREREVTWVKPEVVCEVTFSEWTAEERLRHPVFKGLRTDKMANEVKKEVQVIPSGQKETPENELNLTYGRKKVQLSNLQKVYWPDEKITKGQLLAYYKEMAVHILPHLKDRPLSLNRHPNGIKEPGFFQKDLNTAQIPSWIKYASLESEHLQKKIDYLICNDEATLLWMVNLGCIEINPWLSTYRKPDQPLMAVLDLDPDQIDFNAVITVAKTAKALLDEMKMTVFVKTSGSRGLHIVIPLAAYDDEVAKNFVHYLGGLIYEQHPDITSLERSPSKRKGKIYLDYLQNRKGQTIVAPYSVRPKRGATVSAPLKWGEVDETLRIGNFTIFNMKERIAAAGDLWKDIYKVKNKIKK